MSAIQTDEVKKMFEKLVSGFGHDKVLNKLNIIKAGGGHLLADLIIEKEHTNLYNTLHGGFIATLIDITTSIALGTHPCKAHGVSVDLTISYMSPGRLNEKIIVEANTVKVGNSLGFAEAFIKNENGEILAKGSHTKFIASKNYDMAALLFQ